MSEDTADGGGTSAAGGTAERATSGRTDRNWSTGNWTAIAGFVVLTAVGVAIATGGAFCGSSGGTLCDVTSAPAEDAGVVSIPPYVVLYSTLGALGYAFTKFVNQLERYDDWADFERLTAMALRVPAAWLLAAGVYVLFDFVVGGGGVGNVPTESPPPTDPRLAAGVSFLVGLYVNVTYKSLGTLADKLLS
jgi:hypothetical protein